MTKKVSQRRVSTVRDRPIKSIIKTITWRIVGTIDTILIAYFITGETDKAFSIGVIEIFSKMILYFFHERFWAIIRWGRMMVIIRRNTRKTKSTIKRIIIRR